VHDLILRQRSQIGGAVLFLVHALLGLEHEMPRAVGIYKSRGALVRVGESDGPFEPAVVVAVIIGGRVGPIGAQKFGQLDHEELVIGMLAAAGIFPTGDEIVDLRGGVHENSATCRRNTVDEELLEGGGLQHLVIGVALIFNWMRPNRP
jgi:hypothetical protein